MMSRSTQDLNALGTQHIKGAVFQKKAFSMGLFLHISTRCIIKPAQISVFVIIFYVCLVASCFARGFRD